MATLAFNELRKNSTNTCTHKVGACFWNVFICVIQFSQLCKIQTRTMNIFIISQQKQPSWLFCKKTLQNSQKNNLAQVFSCEFCEIFKNTFFTEHLRETASVTIKNNMKDNQIFTILPTVTSGRLHFKIISRKIIFTVYRSHLFFCFLPFFLMLLAVLYFSFINN